MRHCRFRKIEYSEKTKNRFAILSNFYDISTKNRLIRSILFVNRSKIILHLVSF